MQPFAFWTLLCGLSQREAAVVLNVSLRSVEDYHAGRRRCPDGIIGDLRALRDRIERAAAEGIAAWEAAGRPTSLELGIASDQHEADTLGWPAIGAQRMSLALMVAALPAEVEVRIVPRASTPATAAATDAHDL